MPRGRTLLSCFLLLVAASLASAGCGGSQTASQTPVTQGASSASTGEATPAGCPNVGDYEAASAPSPVLKGSSTFKCSRSDGYTVAVRLRVWAPVRRSAGNALVHPDNPSATASDAVTYDPSTDIAIPWEATIINTTPGFDLQSLSWGVDVYLVPYSNLVTTQEYSVDLAAYLSDGWSVRNDAVSMGDATNSPQMSGDNQAGGATAVGVDSSSITRNGGQTSVDGFVIVHDYYSPSHPSGAKALLSGLAVWAFPDGFSATSSNPLGLSLGGRKARKLY